MEKSWGARCTRQGARAPKTAWIVAFAKLCSWPGPAGHALQSELKPTTQPKQSGTSESVTWGPAPCSAAPGSLGTWVVTTGLF